MSLNTMRDSFHSSAKWILGVVTIAMLFTAYTGIGSILNQKNSPLNAAPTLSPDSAVATVDGQAITRQEFDRVYANAKGQAEMYNPGGAGALSAGQTRVQALNQLISQAEAVEIAERAGVKATDADIQKARDTQVGTLKTELGLKPNATTDDVNSALAKVNGQTVDQIFPDSMLRKPVMQQKYQDYLNSTVVANDAAVQAYYHQFHTRHILISNKTHPDAQAKQQAQQLIDQIKGGADFVALAKQHSDDPGMKNKGGDDGWISQATGYVPEFMNAVNILKTNQVTPQPVLAPEFGYFIIQLLGVRESLPADYAKNKTKYQQQVQQSLQQQVQQKAFADITKTVKVVVDDPLLRAYWVMSQPPTAGQTTNTAQSAALKDFASALKGADYSEKGEIYAQMAQIYQQQNNPKLEIDALNNALTATDDPMLRAMLGDALRKSGDTQGALKQFAQASQSAYNNPQVHYQLQQDYTQMKQPALAAQEQKWLADYMQRSRQANSAPGGMAIPGGGQPIRVTTTAAKPTKVVTTKPAIAVTAKPVKPATQ